MSVTLLLNITAFLGMYHKALLSAYNVCKRFDGCRHRMNYAKATQRTQRHTLRSWQSELLDSLELFKQSVVVQGIATGGRSVSACLHWVITAEEARPLVLDTDVVINQKGSVTGYSYTGIFEDLTGPGKAVVNGLAKQAGLDVEAILQRVRK
jgi:hypothetical protein